MDSGRLRLGTQGWVYTDWVGALYPLGSKQPDFLSLYVRAFDTVEIDSTFYAIPAAKTVRRWVENTPPGFVFSPKLPQEVTHERRLRGAADVLAEFCDRMRGLGDRLGPILVQLGPDFGPDERPTLADFLPHLPGDLRFAVEFRQREWIGESLLALLRDHGVALALSDGRWMPREMVLDLAHHPTADFLYLRWMGETRSLTDHSLVQIDRTEELDVWAETLQPLPEQGIDVFGYFSNYFAGHSPASARELMRRLGQEPVAPEELREQMTLF